MIQSRVEGSASSGTTGAATPAGEPRLARPASSPGTSRIRAERKRGGRPSHAPTARPACAAEEREPSTRPRRSDVRRPAAPPGRPGGYDGARRRPVRADRVAGGHGPARPASWPSRRRRPLPPPGCSGWWHRSPCRCGPSSVTSSNRPPATSSPRTTPASSPPSSSGSWSRRPSLSPSRARPSRSSTTGCGRPAPRHGAPGTRPPARPRPTHGHHALRHVEPDERPGDRCGAAPRVRQPLAHLTRGPWTESGPAAAALVEPNARVQQHGEGPPGRDVPSPRRRERRSRVDHRRRTTRTVPLPCPVVGLLEGDPAGEADVRGFPMAHRLSLGSTPGDGHRLSRTRRRTRAPSRAGRPGWRRYWSQRSPRRRTGSWPWRPVGPPCRCL